MNNKLSALLTTAIVSGLIAAQAAKAEDSSTKASGDQMAAEKNNCKSMKSDDKNSCQGMKKDTKKKKKTDKNSCKNGCGEAKDKKDDSKKSQEKKD